MNLHDKTSWIVYISTFPPRPCGIATFTEDLSNSFNRIFEPHVVSKVIAMHNQSVADVAYDDRVIYTINQNILEDYIRAALHLNSLPHVKLVNIQHEFGIYGGEYGEYLLAFLKALKKPVVITLHTVLPEPDKKRRVIMRRLAEQSDLFFTMTEASKEILKNEYKIDSSKIKIIPHGLHHVPFEDTAKYKQKLGLSQSLTLSTFGLISRNKGIEYALEALPLAVKLFPNVTYMIVGATHPSVVKEEGESYREFLQKRVTELGIENNVKFYNQYVSVKELLQFLQATDIYLATPLDVNQAVSGTLTYALGAGRPVIATAFAQAREVVTEDVGRVVPMRSAEHFTSAIVELFSDELLRKSLGKNAYFKTRPLTWANTALATMQAYSYLIPGFRDEQKHLPRIDLTHVKKMTDERAMLQFSKLHTPDRASGYTADDNARALIALCLYSKTRVLGTEEEALIVKYLDFLKSISRPDGYFENYMFFGGKIDAHRNRVESMDDPTTRSMLALAIASTTNTISKQLQKKAQKLFQNSVRNNLTFASLRSSAFYIKALALWYQQYPSVDIKKAIDRHVANVTTAYKKNAQPGWEWFESQLVYANAVLPDALLQAYKLDPRKNKKLLAMARESMEFLITKTFRKHVYVPIGQDGWYEKDKKRALYDQQPEDPCAMVEALKDLYLITGEERYKVMMQRAFYWFLGNNVQHQIVYDETTGGCYDGLRKDSLNLNQGAESTLAYLISRLLVEDV